VALPDSILYAINIPAQIELTILRGNVFAFQLAIENRDRIAVDLTGLTGSGKVFDAVTGATILTLSVSHSGAAGVVTVTASGTDTAAIPWPVGTQACALIADLGQLSVSLTDGTDTRTIATGSVLVARDGAV
jgi:hypothetical protein